MREEVQKMGGRVTALQAHCQTLEGEAARWQALWRQAAAGNAQLSQRLAALPDGQVCVRAGALAPVFPSGPLRACLRVA